jgi:hypothetical protein
VDLIINLSMYLLVWKIVCWYVPFELPLMIIKRKRIFDTSIDDLNKKQYLVLVLCTT